MGTKRTKKSTKEKLHIPGWRPWTRFNRVPWQPSEGVGLGIGRGEEKVVWEFKKMGRQAKVVGGSFGYDIIELDGRKWEVKEPDNMMSIRPGHVGRTSVSSLVQVIKGISRTIARAIEHSVPIDLAGLESFSARSLKNVEKGEISKGFFFGGTSANPIGLVTIVRSISDWILKRAFVDVTATLKHSTANKNVVIERKFAYDEAVHQIASRYFACPNWKDLKDLASLDVDPDSFFASTFYDEAIFPYIRDPQLLSDLWNKGTSAKETFSETDGLIIVSEKEGFVVIPKAKLDRHVRFQRISQSSARFLLEP